MLTETQPTNSSILNKTGRDLSLPCVKELEIIHRALNFQYL